MGSRFEAVKVCATEQKLTMGKVELIALGTVIKSMLGLITITWTIVLLVGGLIKKDNKLLKKAGLIFLGSWLILLVLGIVEFYIISKY